jgi:adenylate kinase
VEKYGFTHLSTGDLLRNEVQSGSERGKKLNKIMEQGELVPLDAVLGLLTEAMLTNVTSSKGFLIDGYPRELEQGLTFEKQIAECSVILNFDVSPITMTQRLLHRAQTSGRVDDNEDTIKKRLDTFTKHSKPVIEHFSDKCKTIDAERDPTEIFKDVEACLDSLQAAT